MSVYHVYKKIGETPLDVVKRLRKEESIDDTVPMTFAGRLDPAATGLMIILSADDVKQKENYTHLDKEYIIRCALGIATDTGDLLGVIKDFKKSNFINQEKIQESITTLTGKRNQRFAYYSSKMFQGKPLWLHAKEGNNIDIFHDVEIKSINLLSMGTVHFSEILDTAKMCHAVAPVGFRNEIIHDSWQKIHVPPDATFQVFELSVICSSGTYMRVLAEEIGEILNIPTVCLSIDRIAFY